MWRSSSSPRRLASKSESSTTRPPLSPRSTLTEVLRINQFRSKNTSSQSLSSREKEDEATSLNNDLIILANVFPDVKLDVLRELLRRFDGDSRLQICTEQLYRYKAEWTDGRLQVPPRDIDDAISIEEQFRTEQYRNACGRILYKEFSSLNKSAVDAVLAEVNNSYVKARPVLQEIANKSWRATLQSLFRRRKERDSVPAFLWERGKVGSDLVPSGSTELDQELEDLFVLPVRREQAATREEIDHSLAVRLNEKEATDAQALYECQICYSDVPFENISACSAESHTVCLDCVRRSLNEAIFGQNWAQSVDPQRATLKCLAPTSEPCEGHIPPTHLEQAILNDKSGAELWAKFEDRLAEKALLTSQLPLTRCPFCSYAEASQSYDIQSARQVSWSVRPIPVTHKVLAILACEFLLPTLLCFYVLLRLLAPWYLTNVFYTSIAHIANTHRTTRFKCLHPTCGRMSCTKCQKPYHDPHTCHEPLLLSLRQSVEAARTNAVKRVCPRCGTAFVKSSGCNKLTCVCGYSMCYLCRKNIGKTGENEGGEGYRHFCEHFRPVPGQKCTQCEKCDLYKDEDEDVMVRRAGEEAEHEWRTKERAKGGGDLKGLEGVRIDHNLLVGQEGIWERLWRGEWTVQGLSDYVVGQVIIVKI
ncbi:hypothetical protein H2198_010320 [Neophaeococcomyces mojaviensis]|uniref:Uncharacterized protein n=1 Tax=Neophaeococcomyces mojaviensis TaxID=3383035 RepID=A0ACC2ZS55_9EURO|nr:hypothetical protein H2198_010320 [Knufia sp. JES_112]